MSTSIALERYGLKRPSQLIDSGGEEYSRTSLGVSLDEKLVVV